MVTGDQAGGSRVRKMRNDLGLCHQLAVGTQASHLVSLGLVFSSCNMGTLVSTFQELL